MEYKFEGDRDLDVGGHKMWHRLNWAIAMVEKLTSQNMKDMPVELQVEAFKIGTSLFIQSEKR